MKAQGKDIQEITMAIEEQKVIAPEKTFEEIVFAPADETPAYSQTMFQDQSESADELGLTEEDVRYLQLR